jgi:hypothetical protein
VICSTLFLPPNFEASMRFNLPPGYPDNGAGAVGVSSTGAAFANAPVSGPYPNCASTEQGSVPVSDQVNSSSIADDGTITLTLNARCPGFFSATAFAKRIRPARHQKKHVHYGNGLAFVFAPGPVTITIPPVHGAAMLLSAGRITSVAIGTDYSSPDIEGLGSGSNSARTTRRIGSTGSTKDTVIRIRRARRA